MPFYEHPPPPYALSSEVFALLSNISVLFVVFGSFRVEVQVDDPNITIEVYIRLEEEKTHRCVKVYNWKTATHGKIWYNEDIQDLRFVKTEFPAIVFNDTLTSEIALSCEPTVSSLNDEIDFGIAFHYSDDEDYT
nr:hypothetical protein [Tanacetum cinerariifolium]